MTTYSANVYISEIRDMLSQLHAVPYIELIETHISWVFLTGRLAYKIKKPINLGFVDFSTQGKRRWFCLEELRLNKRLAPDLYLNVVTITKDHRRFHINGTGTVVDYAVRLQQFDKGTQFDQLINDNQLTATHIETVAKILANFHKNITPPSCTPPPTYGNPETIHRTTNENHQQCLILSTNPTDVEKINHLAQWSNTELLRIQGFLSSRQQNGFIRECHGDVHLGNIALHNHKVTVFDCIEFNPTFRWIDVINEIAFLAMDLLSHQRQDYATLVLNAYLEKTGDYAGLTGLRYYLVYRAMVRAKVEIIRSDQPDVNDINKQNAIKHFHRYINLAIKLCKLKQPHLIIMHGLSGSGKSTIAKQLQEKLFLIQIRSDVERKRLFHLGFDENSQSETYQGIYSRHASKQTYQRLYTLAETVIQAGYNVLIDATFLRKANRQAFRQLAQKNNTKFAILNCYAKTSTLRNRIQARSQHANTVSEATLNTLEHQLSTQETISAEERCSVIPINTQTAINGDTLLSAILNADQTTP
ncbi:MAG: AAA family ATPase [Gammaproteobacteria bacterium]|nr:AAA family ATPase [Gammaproteobacteria bacterium]